MCLAIPGRLTAIEGGEGKVDYGGISRRADLCLLPDAKIGDMVLVHAGFAIAALDAEEGRELASLTRETLFLPPLSEDGPSGDQHA